MTSKNWDKWPRLPFLSTSTCSVYSKLFVSTNGYSSNFGHLETAGWRIFKPLLTIVPFDKAGYVIGQINTTSCCPSGVSLMISRKDLAHLAWSEAVIEDQISNKHKPFGSWEMQVKIVLSYKACNPPRVSSFAFNPSEQCQNGNLPQITDEQMNIENVSNHQAAPISLAFCCPISLILPNISHTRSFCRSTSHRFHAKRKAKTTVAVKMLKILLSWCFSRSPKHKELQKGSYAFLLPYANIQLLYIQCIYTCFKYV